MPMSDTTRLRKFIKRIDCTRGSSSCWPWLGRRNAKGYGVLRYQYQFWFAHRLAYTLWCGTIPPGFQVQHRKCDNPPCCNPAHLRVGTHIENMAQMVARNRQDRGWRGDRCPPMK